MVRTIKTHETQKNDADFSNDDEIFVPKEFAHLQKATGDQIGVTNYNINSFPKFVKISAYLFVGLLCLFVLTSIIVMFAF
ncbi:hypothetical protein SAFG77S_10068 [Streptomyces afghaniensis]